MNDSEIDYKGYDPKRALQLIDKLRELVQSMIDEQNNEDYDPAMRELFEKRESDYGGPRGAGDSERHPLGYVDRPEITGDPDEQFPFDDENDWEY